jgi:hypothetical protein
MGLSLGFYSFQDCLPENGSFVYIIDANCSKTAIKRVRVFLDTDVANNLSNIRIFDPEGYAMTSYGAWNNPNKLTDLLPLIFWISDKDFHNSFLQ